MNTILRFCTCQDEEPILGYSMGPTITFQPDMPFDLPTSNTCINRLVLPMFDGEIPESETVHHKFDMAFVQTYFGLN